MKWALKKGGGGGYFLNNQKSPVGALLARAPKRAELGIEGEELRDGILNGALMGLVETLTSKEAFRAVATEKALLFEALRYGDLSLL